jgi:hypothetical protein
MSTFESGDRVVVIADMGPLTGEQGTVTNPDYMDHVMVNLDNYAPLSGLGCFLPEELEKLP